MKKLMLILLITPFSKQGLAFPKDMDLEKIIRENSIVVKGLNKMGFDVFKTGKAINGTVEETPKNKVWVEGKSLKDCMGKEKLLNNNTVQCHSGYFKEMD